MYEVTTRENVKQKLRTVNIVYVVGSSFVSPIGTDILSLLYKRGATLRPETEGSRHTLSMPYLTSQAMYMQRNIEAHLRNHRLRACACSRRYPG